MENITQDANKTAPLSQDGSSGLPCGLYIHIPWCVRKCPYCDFNSHAIRDSVPEARYVEALAQDLDADLDGTEIKRISSVYFGGGTPSVFTPASIERILQSIDTRVGLATDIEITMEANPGSVDQRRFDRFRRAGVNRLSIGAQSFNDAHLTTLGRIHDGEAAAAAAKAAAKAGFERFNLDLMFALPRQTIEQALEDVDKALSLEPSHLSCYQLTIEPNTAFAQSPPPMLDGDLASDMHEAIIDRLAENGFARYEVSAYARDGDVSAHNVNYWSFGDYLGIGAGAHGKITRGRLSAGGSVIRRAKVRHPKHYLRATTQAQRTQSRLVVARHDLAFEFMLNALRLTAGFSKTTFTQRTGLPIGDVQPIVDASVRDGLLIDNGDTIRASERGYHLLNDVMARFLPDEPIDKSDPATMKSTTHVMD